MDELSDFDKYYVVQIWSGTDPSAENLTPIKDLVVKELIQKNLASIEDVLGPTPFLPDFFSELYGKCHGYLIGVHRDISPYDIKKTCMSLENDSVGNRICDIDVYVSMWTSIHRKDL